VITVGDYRLLGACAIHVDADALEHGLSEFYDIACFSTSAAYADGTVLAREGLWNFIWVFLNAPEESKTVNTTSSLHMDGIADFSFEASAVLQVGAGGSVAPETPTGLNASSENDAITFHWSANTESDLSGYRLYRTDSAGWSSTLDGSCPCAADNPARRAYCGPVTITEDSYLIAYATSDGLRDSKTKAFIYFSAAPEQTISGRVSADSHSVTAAVWVDLTDVDGYCDIVLACFSGGRYVGMTAENAVNAGGRESVSVAKRLISTAALTDVTVRVMVLRSGGWTPLLPAATLEPS